ncbi:MAG: phosphatase PAP2 family protein [Candidatus Paceibacterota bacterium]
MNDRIFYFFYNFAHRSEIFDAVAIFFAVYFPFIVVISAIIFLLYYRRSIKDFFVVFFASGLAWVIATTLKFYIHTDRPMVVFDNVQVLFDKSSYAFPSGHATFFAALAISIFLIDRRIGYIFMFFTLLIGMARIVAGVHFPIDILGGFIIGPMVAYIIKLISIKFAYFSKNL